MPSLSFKPKPKPDIIYQAVEGFAFAGDPAGPRHIKCGTRLRGSNAIVQATFGTGLWVSDAADDEEVAAARKAAAGLPAASAPLPRVPPRTGYGDVGREQDTDPA